MTTFLQKRWGALLLGLLLIFGLGARADATTTTSFMSSASVVNSNIVLPITQSNPVGTPIYTVSTDHFSCRYGAAEVVFVVHNTATLTIDLNIGGGAIVNVSVDGGANTQLGNGSGRSNYAVTLPNSSDHVIKLSMPSGAGSFVDCYSITTDTGGSFGNPYGTLPDGSNGYGTSYCTLNAGGTASQVWLDAGGGGWRPDPGDYVDNLKADYQTDLSLHFKAKGGSIWIETPGNNQAGVVVPRIDGVDYTPVPLSGGGGFYQWCKIVDSNTIPAFNSTSTHDVILTIVKFGNQSYLNVAGIMVGGSGAQLTTSAITALHTILFMGDSITQGNTFWNHSLYTNQNFPYLLGKALGLSVGNLGIGGMLDTDYFYPPTGYTGNGSNNGSGTSSMNYRYNHTGSATIGSLNAGTYDWLVDVAGTNDYLNVLTGVQIPLLPTDPGAVANANIPTFSASGGTTTTVTTTATFTTANLGQRIVGTSGVNNGRGGFIVGVSGSGTITLTIEPDGGTTWGAANAMDGFSVSGVNFLDQKKRGLLNFLTNPAYSSTKVLICTLFDRTTSASNQATGVPPATLAQYRAQILAVYNTLHALYPSRVYFCDLAGVINPTTQTFEGLHPDQVGAALGEAAMLNVISPPLYFRRGNGGRAGSRSDSAFNSFGISPLIIAQLSHELAYTH